MTEPDAAVLDWIVSRRTGWLTWLANHLLVAGTSTLLLAVVGVAVLGYLVVAAGWPSALTVAVSVVVAFGLSLVLKHLIGRARPPAELALVHPGGFSRPSTDGALSVAGCLALFLVLPPLNARVRRLVAVILVVIVVVIGLCMLYLAAHWLTDVLSGWLLGALVAWGSSATIRTVIEKTSVRETS